MKLLVLVHRLPCPPDRGAKLRSAAQLRWLAERHEVWCAGFVDPPGTGESREAIMRSLDELGRQCRGFCAEPLRPGSALLRGLSSLARGRTLTEGYFHSRRLNFQVEEWSRAIPFDAVLAFSSSMAPLALTVPAPRRVLDLVDLDSRKWQELAEQSRGLRSRLYRVEGKRLEQREHQWIGQFDASLLCTPREAALINDPKLRQRLHVIETGASLNLDPAWADPDHEAALPLPTTANVGFLGAMDYPPNVEGAGWLAAEIWPRIARKHPDAELWIIGRSPTRSVRSLAKTARIHVTGSVPQVEPYVACTRVNVAPLRVARGVQTKVLTAMAMGRPCVVSSCVLEGVGAKPGEEILVADEPEAFAEAVSSLLSDDALAHRIGQAGRAFVKRTFCPAAGLERMEKLLEGEPIETEPTDSANAPQAELATVCSEG